MVDSFVCDADTRLSILNVMDLLKGYEFTNEYDLIV